MVSAEGNSLLRRRWGRAAGPWKCARGTGGGGGCAGGKGESHQFASGAAGREEGSPFQADVWGGGVSDKNTNTLGIPREGGPMPPHHSPPLDPAAHLAPSVKPPCPRGAVEAAEAPLVLTAAETGKASG